MMTLTVTTRLVKLTVMMLILQMDRRNPRGRTPIVPIPQTLRMRARNLRGMNLRRRRSLTPATLKMKTRKPKMINRRSTPIPVMMKLRNPNLINRRKNILTLAVLKTKQINLKRKNLKSKNPHALKPVILKMKIKSPPAVKQRSRLGLMLQTRPQTHLDQTHWAAVWTKKMTNPMWWRLMIATMKNRLY